MRRRRSRISAFAAGLIGLIVIGVACYFVFGGSSPFSGTPYQLKAVFTSETQLHIPSPVRIAGVDVGEVTSVKHIGGSSSQAGLVTMSINPNGLPIHSDATMKIRPRIFLEGNFYVDLQPGTPSAPDLKSGSTVSVGRTAGPVQLDRVLSSLNSETRTNLETLLRGLGSSLNAQPTAARGRLAGSDRPRADRRPGAEHVAEVLARRVQSVGDRQRGAAGRLAPRPIRSGQGQR